MKQREEDDFWGWFKDGFRSTCCRERKHNRSATTETALLLREILISRDHPAKIKGQTERKVNASGQVLQPPHMWNVRKAQFLVGVATAHVSFRPVLTPPGCFCLQGAGGHDCKHTLPLFSPQNAQTSPTPEHFSFSLSDDSLPPSACCHMVRRDPLAWRWFHPLGEHMRRLCRPTQSVDLQPGCHRGRRPLRLFSNQVDSIFSLSSSSAAPPSSSSSPPSTFPHRFLSASRFFPSFRWTFDPQLCETMSRSADWSIAWRLEPWTEALCGNCLNVSQHFSEGSLGSEQNLAAGWSFKKKSLICVNFERKYLIISSRFSRFSLIYLPLCLHFKSSLLLVTSFVQILQITSDTVVFFQIRPKLRFLHLILTFDSFRLCFCKKNPKVFKALSGVFGRLVCHHFLCDSSRNRCQRAQIRMGPRWEPDRIIAPTSLEWQWNRHITFSWCTLKVFQICWIYFTFGKKLKENV